MAIILLLCLFYYLDVIYLSLRRATIFYRGFIEIDTIGTPLLLSH